MGDDASDCKALATAEPQTDASDDEGEANISFSAGAGTHPHENNNHVMAFSRTLRQKLRSHGFRSLSSSSQPPAPAVPGDLERQNSETPSTSSRMVTVVQNIYVYVSGNNAESSTVLGRPLRLRPNKSTDDAFLDDANPKYRACCHHCHVTRSAFIIGLVELVFAAMNLIDAIRHVAVTGRVIPSLFELTFAIMFAGAVVAMIVGVRTERKSLLMPHLVWSIMFVVIGVLVIFTIIIAWLFAGSLLAWTLATAESNIQNEFDKVEIKTALGGNKTLTPIGDEEFNVDGPSDDYFEPPSLARFRRAADPDDVDAEQKKESKAVKNVLWGIVVLLVLIFLLCVGLEIWFFLIIRACYQYLKDKEEFLATIATDGVVVRKPLATVEELEFENELEL